MPKNKDQLPLQNVQNNPTEADQKQDEALSRLMNRTQFESTTESSPDLHKSSPKSSESQAKRPNWKKWLMILVALGVCVLLAAVGYSYWAYQRVHVNTGQRPVAFSDSGADDQPEELKPFTFALLGYGGAGHQGGLLTDSIMLVTIDPNLQKIFMISVPRDLWVSLPVIEGEDESYWKINAAYAIGSDDKQYRRKPEAYTGEAGGGRMAKDTLAKVTGLEVDRFVAVDFTGFKKAVEVLGGIEVDVRKSFTDPRYPIEGREDETCGKSEEEVAATATMPAHLAEKEFPCRFEELYFPKGVIKMDADTALKYARSRHSAQDGGDFNRAARQRQVILAFKNKVLAIDFVPKIIPFVNTVSNHVRTDLSVADMEAFISRQDELLEYEIVGIALTTDDDNVLKFGTGSSGQSIVIPKTGLDDWPTIHDWLANQMTQADPVADLTPAEATASAKEIDVVVSRPPETVAPIGQQDATQLQLVAQPASLNLQSDGDWSDQTVIAQLTDQYGNLIPNQEDVSFRWDLEDKTLAEIDSENDCPDTITAGCPNLKLMIKPQKTGTSKITLTAYYQDEPLPVPVIEIPVEVKSGD